VAGSICGLRRRFRRIPSLFCGGADETEQLALAGTARAALLVRGVGVSDRGRRADPGYPSGRRLRGGVLTGLDPSAVVRTPTVPRVPPTRSRDCCVAEGLVVALRDENDAPGPSEDFSGFGAPVCHLP